MYISLFNGRQHPDQDMQKQPDLGTTGPVIGPVNITWVLGNARVHTLDGSHFHFLPTSSDGEFIYINGVHYADFVIWEDNHPKVEENRSSGLVFLDFEAVQKLPDGPDQAKRKNQKP